MGIAVINMLGNGLKFNYAVNRTTLKNGNSSINFHPTSSSFTVSLTVLPFQIGSSVGTFISNGSNNVQGWYIEAGPTSVAAYFWNGAAAVNPQIVPGNFLNQVLTIVWSYTPTSSFLNVNGIISQSSHSVYAGSYASLNGFYLGNRPSPGSTTGIGAYYHNLSILNHSVSVADSSKIVASDGLFAFPFASYVALVDFEQKSGAVILNKRGTLGDFALEGTSNTALGSLNAWVDEYQQPILN